MAPSHPSYLAPASDEIRATVSVADDPGTGMVEISVHDMWSRRLGLNVSARLGTRLANRPGAVIIDLLDLVDEDAASLPLWLAARRAAAVIRPPVPLALCLPATAVLEQRLRRICARRLPVFATRSEARTAMTNRLGADPVPRHGEVQPPPERP